MSDDGQDNPWITRRRELRYANRWIEVHHDEVTDPSGKPGIYGVVHFRSLAVGVVPVDAEGHTWLVGQWRYPHRHWSWEIPEGGGPLDVDPVETAQRELAEETGLTAGHYLPLLTEVELSNSVTDERAFAYLAWDLTPGPTQWDSTERLSLHRLPLRTAIAQACDGTIRDAISILALLKVDALWRDAALPAVVMAALGTR